MRVLVLMVAIAVLLLEDVASEGVIKKGTFPFMAFLYYSDQATDNSSETKFTRNAILIRENWLISASLENENSPVAFPEKTLMARLGTISIDNKFNFNEDENEQEREIIRIARPYDFSSTKWWYNDISLLKTLFPFDITSVVAPFPIRGSKLNSAENCFMLVYCKQNQKPTEGRILMKILVELIPPSQDKCGSNFSNDTMVCATSSDEKSKIYSESNFCLGNSGGPLICDNELIGIQTYIDNCDQPYLYQYLNYWDDLISCATEDKCQEEQCAKICFTINKDPITVQTPEVLITEIAKIKLADGYVNETSIEIIKTPTLTTVAETSETETVKTTFTTLKEEQNMTEITISTFVSHVNTFEDILSESNETTEKETTKFPEERERKTNVEAKQHVLRSDASVNTSYLFKYFMYGYYIIVRLS